MFTKEVKASANAELDKVMELLCELIQIPPSMWEDAKEKYRAVGEWLAGGSVLDALKPDIKYQGSAIIETVVRPWQREEFDIDLLCILDASSVRYPNPGAVYDLVANRLAEHKTYRRLMTRKERCIELGYAGQFHLDIVPAIPRQGTGERLLIPDRKRNEWIATDPFRYASWFYSRTPVTKLAANEARMQKDIAPIRPAKRASEIAPLQRTIQLMKRRRDLFFAGDDDAPKSIALTTLTTNHYGGEALCTNALLGVLDGIQREIERTNGILVIPNPVDPSENLGRHWNQKSYQLFKKFVQQFQAEMDELMALTGWARITDALENLFGERARSAVDSYAKSLEEKRRSRGLTYGAGATILTTGTSGKVHKVPRNEFFGQ